ncbi:MAG: glycosyltransferase family 2 protein [Syntrophobacteraceae bacterium]
MNTIHAQNLDFHHMEQAEPAIELSVVMPCLNEAKTVGSSVDQARRTLLEHGISGEVIVADNGSNDGSQKIAECLGARVVAVKTRGYSNALRGGIAQARGRYVLIGDPDGSYDFTHIPRFLERLREGYDLVVGNRFKGGIAPGAMKPLHRYVGVPIMSAIARVLFRSPCGDHHCGLRAFRKSSFERLDLRADGWEFNSEMIARASILGMRITEVPTTLVPDGRGRPPHLRSFSAGWQHLRMMLLYSPRFIFFYPGILMMVFGIVTMGMLMNGPRFIAGIRLNIIAMLYAAAAVIIGFQGIIFGILAKIYGISQGIYPDNSRLSRLTRTSPLEPGLILAAVLLFTGLLGAVVPLISWTSQGFILNAPLEALRILIPSVTCLVLGFQVILCSFFLSILRMRNKPGAVGPKRMEAVVSDLSGRSR